MTTPDTLFELDMDTGERRVLKQTEVPGFDAANYRSEHLWIVARDGVEFRFRWSTIANIFAKDTTRCWCMAMVLTAQVLMPISVLAA
ncbi:hypothetical protein OIU89_02580 [Escherichia coli]|nr:hypothetical protein [Escherichia coli]